MGVGGGTVRRRICLHVDGGGGGGGSSLGGWCRGFPHNFVRPWAGRSDAALAIGSGPISLVRVTALSVAEPQFFGVNSTPPAFLPPSWGARDRSFERCGALRVVWSVSTRRFWEAGLPGRCVWVINIFTYHTPTYWIMATAEFNQNDQIPSPTSGPLRCPRAAQNPAATVGSLSPEPHVPRRKKKEKKGAPKK